MDGVLYDGEVQLTLEAVNPSADFAEPRRELLLSKSAPTITIGRASRHAGDQGSGRVPSLDNGFINAPVMSRTHAIISFDPESKKIYVEDNGSTHGTFYNDAETPLGERQELKEGDAIAFGISIQRDETKYPQCKMAVTALSVGTNARNSSPRVFSAPDIDLDISDAEEDDIEQTMAIIDLDDDADDEALDFIDDDADDQVLEVIDDDESLSQAVALSEKLAASVEKDVDAIPSVITFDSDDEATAKASSVPPLATEMTAEENPKSVQLDEADGVADQEVEPSIAENKATTPVDIVDPERTSSKRKHEDISVLVEEEVLVEQVTLPALETVAAAPVSQNDHEGRRVRMRFAEALGYAALGGIAVMATLIATAPTL